MAAYSEALVFESARDLPYDRNTDQYVLAPDILEYFARIIAYKVAYNIMNGHVMDPSIDPLTYIDCRNDPDVDE